MQFKDECCHCQCLLKLGFWISVQPCNHDCWLCLKWSTHIDVVLVWGFCHLYHHFEELRFDESRHSGSDLSDVVGANFGWFWHQKWSHPKPKTGSISDPVFGVIFGSPLQFLDPTPVTWTTFWPWIWFRVVHMSVSQPGPHFFTKPCLFTVPLNSQKFYCVCIRVQPYESNFVTINMIE